MENQKDKEAFFAQYWGQKVGIIGTGKEYKSNAWINGSYFHSVNSLILKSLENISDEDLREIGIICANDNSCVYTNEFYIDLGKNILERYSFDLSVQIADYLRLCGYLLPFRNYKIEQILEMGWAKYEH